MNLTASALDSLFIGLGFGVLWLWRKRGADHRRLVCLCVLFACSVIWAFTLVPSSWLPKISPALPVRASDSIQRKDLSPTTHVSDPHMSRLQMPGPKPISQEPRPVVDSVYWIGVGIGLLVWISGWMVSLSLVRRSRPAPRASSDMSWPILLAPGTEIPLCLGWPWRSILLPNEAESWDESILEVVLRHEGAHLYRRDHFWINLASLLCALQWFNPLAWLLAARLRLECEHTADDVVLSSGVKSSDYADLLLKFQGRKALEFPLCALQPLHRPSGLAKRMTSILSPNTDRRIMKTKTTAAIVVASIASSAFVSGFAFSLRERPVSPRSSDIVGKPVKTRFTGYYDLPRKVELLQVGLKSQGKMVVWDSNGKRVPAAEMIEHPWIEDQSYAGSSDEKAVPIARSVYRHIVFRVQAETNDGVPQVSCEPADDSNPGAGFREMNSTDDYLMTKDGWHYFMHAEAITPVSLSQAPYSDTATLYGVGKTSLLVSVALTKPVDQGPVADLPLFSAWTASNYSGKLLGDEVGAHNNKDGNSKLWSKVVFTHPNLYWSTAHFYRVDGREIPDSLVEGWFIDSGGFHKPIQGGYYIGVPASEIGEVRMTTRKGVYVELSGIPMSPVSTQPL